MANEDLETRRDASNDNLDQCAELTIDQVDELFADDLFADDLELWSSEAWRAPS